MAQANFLERLVAEWYQYRGWYVQMNVQVGKRTRGGYDSELDILAFNPKRKEVHHYEASMDSHTWAVREKRFGAKFRHGREYVASQFPGSRLKQFALMAYVRSQPRTPRLGGATIVTLSELFQEMTTHLQDKPVAKAAVPENYPLLRTLQFYIDFGGVA